MDFVCLFDLFSFLKVKVKALSHLSLAVCQQFMYFIQISNSVCTVRDQCNPYLESHFLSFKMMCLLPAEFLYCKTAHVSFRLNRTAQKLSCLLTTYDRNFCGSSALFHSELKKCDPFPLSSDKNYLNFHKLQWLYSTAFTLKKIKKKKKKHLLKKIKKKRKERKKEKRK